MSEPDSTEILAKKWTKEILAKGTATSEIDTDSKMSNLIIGIDSQDDNDFGSEYDNYSGSEHDNYSGSEYGNDSLSTRKYENFLPNEYKKILNELSETPTIIEITEKELPVIFLDMNPIKRRNINDIKNTDDRNLINGYDSKVTIYGETTIKSYYMPHVGSEEIKKK
jgi:hypothetical protein